MLDARAAGAAEGALREWARTVAPADVAHSSRSYRYPYALVAWHERPVGVDLERIEACDEAFAESICTPEEKKRLAGADDGLITSLWCAKEALSKALGHPLAYDPRRLEGPLVWPEGRSGPWRAEQISAPEGYLAWLCWRDPS